MTAANKLRQKVESILDAYLAKEEKKNPDDSSSEDFDCDLLEPILALIDEQCAQARAEAIAEFQGIVTALRYYANRHHFELADDNAWDTVSGETQNFWCDDAGTATIEDGTIAKLALRGETIHWIEDGEDCTPKQIDGEAIARLPASRADKNSALPINQRKDSK